jgi:hypothetical protein
VLHSVAGMSLFDFLFLIFELFQYNLSLYFVDWEVTVVDLVDSVVEPVDFLEEVLADMG